VEMGARKHNLSWLDEITVAFCKKKSKNYLDLTR
jgi:hypothetical protein